MKAAKFYYAFGVKNNQVVLIRCKTKQEAQDEYARLRHSDSDTIGVTRRKATEEEAKSAASGKEWKITLIRDAVPVPMIGVLSAMG